VAGLAWNTQSSTIIFPFVCYFDLFLSYENLFCCLLQRRADKYLPVL
jgi:hypothetical protein